MMMDWDTLVKRYGLAKRVTGVLHCGAHLAEEASDYDQAFVSDVPVWWVEANPDVFGKIDAVLAEYPGQVLVPALLGEHDGEVKTFHVTNYDGMSSSVLEFGTHPDFSPDTVFVKELELTTSKIDTLVETREIHDVNMLVMDLQGYEGPVLRGAAKLLPSIDFVMSEVNKAQVYKGATQVEELDRLLYDFVRVETLWVSNFGWGDALWTRK